MTALSSLVALSERIADMAREEVRQEEARSDAELAEIYRNIEERIAFLALEEARRLAVEVLGVPREEVDEKLPWRFWTRQEEGPEEEAQGAGRKQRAPPSASRHVR